MAPRPVGGKMSGLTSPSVLQVAHSIGYARENGRSLPAAAPIPLGVNLAFNLRNGQVQLILDMEAFFFLRLRRVFGYIGEIAMKSPQGADSCSHFVVVFSIFPKKLDILKTNPSCGPVWPGGSFRSLP